MPGSRKNNRTDGKSTNQSLDNLSGTGDRKSKRSRTAALAALTPSTVSSSYTSTPMLTYGYFWLLLLSELSVGGNRRGRRERIRGGFLTLSTMALMAGAGAEDDARQLC